MELPGTTQWHRVAGSLQQIPFPANRIALVMVAGIEVCVTVYRDRLYAFSNKCPHASAPLCDGFVDALGNVACPLHNYRFNLKNGRDTNGEGYFLKRFPIEERADGLFIGM